jgi:hypothetical protein
MGKHKAPASPHHPPLALLYPAHRARIVRFPEYSRGKGLAVDEDAGALCLPVLYPVDEDAGALCLPVRYSSINVS